VWIVRIDQHIPSEVSSHYWNYRLSFSNTPSQPQWTKNHLKYVGAQGSQKVLNQSPGAGVIGGCERPIANAGS
ncbi:mCG146335, partial [Mus musculus]